MTSDAVRVYLTEAIARVETEHRVRGYERDGDPTCYCGWHGESIAHHRDEERLTVVETLRTPCLDCDGTGIRRTSWTVHPNLNAGELDCMTCGGTGQSALLAFDEMRGMEQVGFRGYFTRAPVIVETGEPINTDTDLIVRFPVALSPDTTETP